MKKKMSYDEQLKDIYDNIQKSFGIKFGLFSAFATNKYLKKLVKLNRKTRNKNIDEIINVIGNVKLDYKKYCNENDFYTDPYVNGKIKDAYIKLSKKSLKIKTKRKNVKNNDTSMEIEYNSDKGIYEVTYFKNGIEVDGADYEIRDIKNLDKRRKRAIKMLKEENFGIDVFDELGLSKRKFSKINPQIIYILVKEGKLDYAKMYMKEVMEGNTIHKPFKIKYTLNRDLKKGVFSEEENRNMKKMAKADRVANELVIFDDRKEKKLPQFKTNIIKKLKELIVPGKLTEPQFAYDLDENIQSMHNDFVQRNRVERNTQLPPLKRVNTSRQNEQQVAQMCR